MTHYSNDPGMVRVDFFRPSSGKWYMTEALDMASHYNHPGGPHAAVRAALSDTRHGADAENRWLIVVLDPYHVNSYPITLTPGRATYEPYPEYQRLVQPSEVVQAIDDVLNIDTGLDHPGLVWCSFYGLHIGKADGWRIEGWEKSIQDSITRTEFLWRLSKSSHIEGDYLPLLETIRGEIGYYPLGGWRA